jgi:hypothetical protein
MNWKLWEKGPRRLPRRIKQYLLREFGLKFGVDREKVEHVRMVTKRGLFCGKQVIFIRIVNPPSRLVQKSVDIEYSTYDDFPQNVLFEGYQEGRFISLNGTQ